MDYTWIIGRVFVHGNIWMKKYKFNFSTSQTLLVPLLLVLLAGITEAGENNCSTEGDFNFVCGPASAEDLVLIPGTRWIIASGMVEGSAITLIDSQQKSWSELYPADAPRAVQDMKTYGACPGSPDPNHFISHGLNIRPGENGHSTLYVVGHGGREAIEVFDVDASGTIPRLTWTGCILTPGGQAINSVASFSDGSLVATIPLRTGTTISQALGGKLTGGVYQWSPGDNGFEVVEGTDLPYANGIEVSADDREFFVASSGGNEVIAYSRTNPARRLRSTRPLTFIPDNLHVNDDGRLITAGLVIDDPVCGNLDGSKEFNLEEFASCPRPFIVTAIDPKTMDDEDLVRSAAIQQFSNVTMGLQVGGEIWIGTFAGDRVAYGTLEADD